MSGFAITKRLLNRRQDRQHYVEEDYSEIWVGNPSSEWSQKGTADHTNNKDPRDRMSRGESVGGEMPHVSVIRSFLPQLLDKKCGQRGLIKIAHLDVGVQEYVAAAGDDATVEFIIFSTHQPLIKKSDALEKTWTVETVWNRISGTLGRASSESGVAHAELVGAQCLHEPAGIQERSWLGNKQAANVVGAGTYSRLKAKLEVVGRILGVSVEPKDPIAPRILDSGVEGEGCESSRVVYTTDPWVMICQLADQRHGAIIRTTIDNEEFKFGVLRQLEIQHGLNALFYEGFFIPAGD